MVPRKVNLSPKIPVPKKKANPWVFRLRCRAEGSSFPKRGHVRFQVRRSQRRQDMKWEELNRCDAVLSSSHRYLPKSTPSV
ncbi:hypothetical protein NDU88_003910 [Pleurodeles waltl]|uniref:Uncharacterized protein n=1 Tax=Pleurodeles waltl TaxID=8319 RepID=A0AAV7MCH2_PLEWA|nr:hypothetical protein NDU88_003910 [Pleurodeles waltl]